MSYIFNNKIEYSDSFNLDAFGRLRVSNVTSLLEITHVYNSQPFLVNQALSGTASSVWYSSDAAVEMSVINNNDYVVRQTRNSAIYQPGKGQLFEASFSDFNIQSDVIKRVGYYTSTTASTYNSNFDGFFLESNGVTNEISFQIWNSGNITYSATTAEWDNSQLDINTIDWSKTHLMLVDFQWLGVGRVRFGLSLSGNTYVFSESFGTNTLDNVYMTSPNKPIRYEIRSVGGLGFFRQICSQVSMEGSLNTLNIPASFATLSSISLPTQNVKYALMGFKMSSNYAGISPILRQVTILNTTNDNYILTAELNPVISGAYTFSADTNTGIMYSFASGTQTISSAGVIIGSFVGEAGTQVSNSFTFEDSKFKSGTNINGQNDELWLCIRPLSNSSTYYASANLYYYS